MIELYILGIALGVVGAIVGVIIYSVLKLAKRLEWHREAILGLQSTLESKPPEPPPGTRNTRTMYDK